MKKIIWIALLSLSLVILVACGSAEGTAPEAVVAEAEAAPAQTEQQVTPESATAAAVPGETLVDEQGAVAVAVTPRNLDPGATVLDFEVAMNTHSVDLSMDLAELATLTTDSGTQITASSWDAPQGGHHVSGVLSFNALGEAGPLLDGATTLTLTLVNVDAPERSFTWSLK